MQELRLVAVSEDGSYAVLVVPGRSGRFALPIDERLRTVARGQFSRLAQYEIEVESPLRPKEIQDRIRAGETAEEIADAAGLPVDRIRRFEGPVLAEREFRATEAQRATVRVPGESGLGQRLGEIVIERLADLGAGSDDQEWDSRKRQDGNWQVQLAYTVAGRMYVAEWVYDPKSKHVTPADDEAIRLSLDEAHWPEPRALAPSVKATVTPIGSRMSGHHSADNRAEPDRLAANRAMMHPSRAVPAGPPSAPPAVQPVAVPLAAPSPAPDAQVPGGPAQPVAADQVPAQPAAARAAVSTPAAVQPAAAAAQIAAAAESAPRTGQGRPDPVVASDAPADAQALGAASEEADEEPPAEAQPASATPPARPARRAGGSRSRRSSVPSWDEIMFGTSRQPE